MPPKSAPWLVLEQLVEWLGDISVADGYWTDAGQAIYLGGTPALGDDDADVGIAVVPGDISILQQQANILSELPVEIQALAKADSITLASTIAWRVESDIRRAVEREDRTLGGLLRDRMRRGPTRILEREPGSLTVGIGATYMCPYREGWGQP